MVLVNSFNSFNNPNNLNGFGSFFYLDFISNLVNRILNCEQLPLKNKPNTDILSQPIEGQVIRPENYDVIPEFIPNYILWIPTPETIRAYYIEPELIFETITSPGHILALSIILIIMIIVGGNADKPVNDDASVIPRYCTDKPRRRKKATWQPEIKKHNSGNIKIVEEESDKDSHANVEYTPEEQLEHERLCERAIALGREEVHNRNLAIHRQRQRAREQQQAYQRDLIRNQQIQRAREAEEREQAYQRDLARDRRRR